MEHLGPTYSDGHYQQLFYVIFSLFCRYVNAEVHTPKASKYAPQDCTLKRWHPIGSPVWLVQELRSR